MRHLTALSLLFISASFGTGLAEEPSTCSWDITADALSGTLEITLESRGQVSGTLLGQSVEGSLVGRHLVLVRQGADGREHWDGWIATKAPSGLECPALAGTFSRLGADGPLPWFGTGVAATKSASHQVSLDQARPPAVPIPTPVPSPSSAPSPPSAAPQASKTPSQMVIPILPDGRISFAGTWLTPSGYLEIRQEGSRLTFVLPDREVSGRVIGADTVIGSFGPGCCKGTVEQGFTVIAWDNGVRWTRQ